MTARVLEDTQIKFRQDGQQRVENIGLDAFIVGPDLVLHRMQGDVRNIPVRPELLHFDPVTDPHQIIGGELQIGDKTQQGVLEDKEDNGGKTAQNAEDTPGRFVGENGNDGNNGTAVNNNANDIQLAANGLCQGLT